MKVFDRDHESPGWKKNSRLLSETPWSSMTSFTFTISHSTHCNIPAIWKHVIKFSISKVGKPADSGTSFCHIVQAVTSCTNSGTPSTPEAKPGLAEIPEPDMVSDRATELFPS